MFAGTFSEKGGQERIQLDSDETFLTFPTVLLSLPTLELVFWVGKNAIVARPN